MEKTVSRYTKKKVATYLMLCVLGFAVLQVVILILQRMGHSNFNGVFMAMQFALCIIMVRIDYKVGFFMSIVLNGLATIMLLQAIIVGHNMGPLSGLFNTVIYIISLYMLARQFKIREDEAVTDMLTGFYNRRGLYIFLKKKIKEKKKFSVIYIDLGNFKAINDNYGHGYGDALLKIVAQRIDRVVGKRGVTARMGGDEFVAVVDGNHVAEGIANEILNSIREKATNTINGISIECYLTAYAGISEFPKNTNDFEALIKYADIAMYEAMNNKTNDAVLFDENMETQSKRIIEIEKLIKEGLENKYFYLNYQPQYAIDGKKLRGFEALVRVRTPDGKMVSPGEFISVAEKTDLILEIDEYVINRALTETKELVDRANSDLVISINVSAKNIGSEGFADRVIAKLKEAKVAARNIEIEITEYCLANSVDITIGNIKKLRDYGVQVALDDFGTGYTSLSYLFKMPVDLLKIDKSLIDNVENNSRNADFVKAVIEMGHLLGCEVIAEGVEQETQVGRLDQLKCDLIQGYVWGKPMDFEMAKDLVTIS